MQYKKLPNDINNIIGKESSIAGVNDSNQLIPSIQERGVWTPKFIGYGGGEAQASMSYGRYLKIGNLVTVSIDITWADVGNLEGYVCIGNFPFQADNSDGNGWNSVPISYRNKILNAKDSIIFLTPMGNGSAFHIRQTEGASFSNLSAANFQNGSSIAGTFSYICK